jgi:hypothetical protein
MTYSVTVKAKTYAQDGEWTWLYEPLLPGFIPGRVLDMMEVRFVEDELRLCRECEMACKCHVIEFPGGRKLCTVLFHDAVRPRWRLKDVI